MGYCPLTFSPEEANPTADVTERWESYDECIVSLFRELEVGVNGRINDVEKFKLVKKNDELRTIEMGRRSRRRSISLPRWRAVLHEINLVFSMGSTDLLESMSSSSQYSVGIKLYFLFLSPPYPANNSIRLSLSRQMSLPPGNYTPVPKYLCTCRKCGSSGKVLARMTWYNHSPGGKKAKPLEFSQDQVDFIRSLPPPTFSERRQRICIIISSVALQTKMRLIRIDTLRLS